MEEHNADLLDVAMTSEEESISMCITIRVYASNANENDEEQLLSSIPNTSYSTFDDQISPPSSSVENSSQGISSENDGSDSD